jgi:hypothetical protein
MHVERSDGWFAQWRGERRARRQEASDRSQRRQEQLDELLAEYPVDPSQRSRTRSRSEWDGYAGGGGFWLGSGGGDGDCGDGGFWSGLFGGDWGGFDGGGC